MSQARSAYQDNKDFTEKLAELRDFCAMIADGGVHGFEIMSALPRLQTFLSELKKLAKTPLHNEIYNELFQASNGFNKNTGVAILRNIYQKSEAPFKNLQQQVQQLFDQQMQQYASPATASSAQVTTTPPPAQKTQPVEPYYEFSISIYKEGNNFVIKFPDVPGKDSRQSYINQLMKNPDIKAQIDIGGLKYELGEDNTLRISGIEKPGSLSIKYANASDSSVGVHFLESLGLSLQDNIAFDRAANKPFLYISNQEILNGSPGAKRNIRVLQTHMVAAVQPTPQARAVPGAAATPTNTPTATAPRTQAPSSRPPTPPQTAQQRTTPVTQPAATPSAQAQRQPAQQTPLQGKSVARPYFETLPLPFKNPADDNWKTTPPALTDEQQADAIIKRVKDLKDLHKDPNFKVGITYSANQAQTEAINNFNNAARQGKPQDWSTLLNSVNGAGQAKVMNILIRKLALPENQGVKDRIRILPVTTMQYVNTNLYSTTGERLHQDLNNINSFVTEGNGYVLGWANQYASDERPFAIGGGVARQVFDAHQDEYVQSHLRGLATRSKAMLEPPKVTTPSSQLPSVPRMAPVAQVNLEANTPIVEALVALGKNPADYEKVFKFIQDKVKEADKQKQPLTPQMNKMISSLLYDLANKDMKIAMAILKSTTLSGLLSERGDNYYIADICKRYKDKSNPKFKEFDEFMKSANGISALANKEAQKTPPTPIATAAGTPAKPTPVPEQPERPTPQTKPATTATTAPQQTLVTNPTTTSAPGPTVARRPMPASQPNTQTAAPAAAPADPSVFIPSERIDKKTKFQIDGYAKVRDSDVLESHLVGETEVGSCEIEGARNAQEDRKSEGVLRLDKLKDPAQVQQVFTESFADINKSTEAMPEADNMGSTCISVTAWKDAQGNLQTCTASVGDSEAFLVVIRANGDVEAEGLNPLHNPSDKREQDRVTAAGGFIQFKRLAGVLAVTRAFGDHALDGTGLSHEPYFNMPPPKPLYPGDRAFIVAGCDGLSEHVHNVTHAEAVAKIVSANKDKTPQEIARTLVNSAFRGGSTDNISATVFEVKSTTPTSVVICDGHGGPQVAAKVISNFFSTVSARLKAALDIQEKAKVSAAVASSSPQARVVTNTPGAALPPSTQPQPTVPTTPHGHGHVGSNPSTLFCKPTARQQATPDTQPEPKIEIYLGKNGKLAIKFPNEDLRNAFLSNPASKLPGNNPDTIPENPRVVFYNVAPSSSTSQLVLPFNNAADAKVFNELLFKGANATTIDSNLLRINGNFAPFKNIQVNLTDGLKALQPQRSHRATP